jgi:hypothetical protein
MHSGTGEMAGRGERGTVAVAVDTTGGTGEGADMDESRTYDIYWISCYWVFLVGDIASRLSVPWFPIVLCSSNSKWRWARP